MTETPTVLILAGGFATRLWPLTEKRAKPLLPLAGKPLIQHILDKIPANFPVIISTNQAFQEDFEALSAAHTDRDIQVFIEDSADDKSKKGALGATALVLKEYGIDSPLLLIAGDNYFGFDLEAFLQSYDGKTLLASFDTQSLHRAKQFGVLTVDGTRLTSFVEKPEDPPSTLISTGCYLFSPDHFGDIHEYAAISKDNLGGIFEHLLEKSADIDVFAFTEDWIDIGSFESYLDAHQRLLPHAEIHPSAQLTNVEIGSSVDIGADCVLENCELDQVIILSGCTIRNARLRGCIVDHDCEIEGLDLDHKMIRSGSILRGEDLY